MDETGMGIKIITGGVTAARGFKADLQPGALQVGRNLHHQYCEGSSCKMG